MQSTPKVEELYVDFMRVIPNLTHFMDKTALNDRFSFLTSPALFGSEYLLEIENSSSRYFIHNFGALKTLPSRKWNYSFWRNLFGSPDLQNYVQNYLGEYFGYLPFFIKSTSTLSIEPDPNGDRALAQILNRAKIALTLRFFPFGATAVHLMVFFRYEKADVKQFIEIQKALLNGRFFKMQGPAGQAKNLGLSEIFDDAQKKLYSTLYNRPPNGAFEAKPGEIHRILYLHLVDADQLAATDVKLAAASLIDLSLVKSVQDIGDLLLNQVQKSKSQNDLLVFHPRATLLYAPNLNPFRKGFCLWNNCINVVEMATLQNFILAKTNHLLNEAVSSYPDFKEFADNAAQLQVIGKCFDSLRGGHRHLYNEIDNKLVLSGHTQQYFRLLKCHQCFQVYEALKQQIQETEALLTQMKEVASDYNFNQIGILMIDYLLDVSSSSVNSLSQLTKKLREIDARERHENKLPTDSADERICRLAILAEITKYKKTLLNLEHLIGKVADYLEQAGVDVSLTRIKLGEAQQIGIGNYTYDSASAFIVGTKDYFEKLSFSIAQLPKNT